MNLLNIDSVIVFFYLLFTLVIGIYKGRNIKGMKEYAVGDYKFSNSAMVATITATWIGGGPTIGIHESVYKYGIIWILIFLGSIFEIIILQKISPKVIKFKGCYSAAEIVKIWFGPKAGIVSGICLASYSLGIIATQISVIGYLFHEFFQISATLGILIAAGIVVIYSSFGGIKSVTTTDMIQFAFFMVALPVIASTIFAKTGGYENIINNLPAEHLKIFPSYGTITGYIMMFLFFALPSCDACLIQRILIAKDKEQIVYSFKTTVMVMILFYSLCGLIALSVRSLNPNLDPNNLLYYAINNYLPIGIKGLGIAGLLAVVMSTADSYINSSSIAIINDVINPLKRRPLSDKQALFVTKITSLIIGIASIFIAINFKSITELMIKSWILWAPIVIVPLYAAFLGVRSNSKIFFLSAASGIAMVIIWAIFDIEEKTGIDSVVPGLLFNLIVFILLTIYYYKLSPDKLNNPKLPNPEAEESKIFKFSLIIRVKGYLEYLSKSYYKYFPTFNNIARFSRNRVHYYGAQYKLFGTFAIISFMIPYFMWSEANDDLYFKQEDLILLRFIACSLAFGLIIYDAISKKYQRYLPLYWHFTLLYSLPFMTTFLFLYNHGTTEWMINMALSLFILAALTDWLSFLILLTTGTFLGYRFYAFTHGANSIDIILGDIHKAHLFLYITIFASIIGMLFSRNREYIQQQVVSILDTEVKERTKDLEEALIVKKEFINNLNHEIRTPVMGIITFCQALYSQWTHITEEKRLQILENLNNSVERFYSFIDNILDMSKFECGKIYLDIKVLDIKELVTEIIAEFETLKLKKEIAIYLDLQLNDYMLKADYFKIKQVIRTLISNSLKYSKKGPLTVTVREGQEQLEDGNIVKGVMVSVADFGVGIPEEELEIIFEPFVQSSRTKTMAGGRGLSLTVSRKIIEAHLGKIWAQNNQQNGATFSFIIPRKVNY